MEIIKFGKDAKSSNVEVYLVKNDNFFRPYMLSFHFVDVEIALEQRHYWTLQEAEKAFREATGVRD